MELTTNELVTWEFAGCLKRVEFIAGLTSRYGSGVRFGVFVDCFEPVFGLDVSPLNVCFRVTLFYWIGPLQPLDEIIREQKGLLIE